MTATAARTAECAIEITCPSWCVVPAQDHADELWDWGGDCIHKMQVAVIEDTVGFGRALQEPRMADPFHVELGHNGSPSGDQTSSAVVLLGRASWEELTISQALAVADEINRQVRVYRDGGGLE